MPTTTLCIFSGYVAGVLHSKPNFSFIREGTSCHLVFEPHNAWDPNAIAVVGEPAQKFGYIPREATFSIKSAVAQGLKPKACVVKTSQTKFKEILVRVFVEVAV